MQARTVLSSVCTRVITRMRVRGGGRLATSVTRTFSASRNVSDLNVLARKIYGDRSAFIFFLFSLFFSLSVFYPFQLFFRGDERGESFVVLKGFLRTINRRQNFE